MRYKVHATIKLYFDTLAEAIAAADQLHDDKPPEQGLVTELLTDDDDPVPAEDIVAARQEAQA